MDEQQILTSSLFSLRGIRWIHNQHGELQYAARRPKIFGRAIEIFDASGQVKATIDPQVWKSFPTWVISTPAYECKIKRKIKSFERSYWIEDGPFNGALIEGESLDLKYRIQWENKIIAHASAADPFSATAKHVVTVLDKSDEARLLIACVGVIIVRDKHRESS